MGLWWEGPKLTHNNYSINIGLPVKILMYLKLIFVDEKKFRLQKEVKYCDEKYQDHAMTYTV